MRTAIVLLSALIIINGPTLTIRLTGRDIGVLFWGTLIGATAAVEIVGWYLKKVREEILKKVREEMRRGK